MDLRRLLTIARPWYPLAIACVVVASLLAFVVSSMQTKTYESQTTLIVGQSLSAANPDYNQILVSQRLSTTYAAVATTRPILDAVISELGLNTTPEELATRVRADAAVSSTLLTISAQDDDAERAAAIANSVAKQLIAASPSIQGRQADLQASIDQELKDTQAQIDATQGQAQALSDLPSRTDAQEAQLATLESRLVTLRSTYATLLSFSSNGASNLLSVIEPAVASDSPVWPRPVLNTLLAAVLGLLVAVGIATTLNYIHDAVRDPEDVQEVTGLGTLASIGRMRGGRTGGEVDQLVAISDPRSSAAESYRTLRTNIEFEMLDRPLRTLLVTGCTPDEGKTVTAANLAAVIAQGGRRVVLVDADLRKPGVHAVFGLPNMHGLTTLLRDPSHDIDAISHASPEANLRILTTGPLPPNPAELLGSSRLRVVLEALTATGDLIVLDSPPVLAVADSAILSSVTDATVLVVDAGHSSRRAVRRGTGALARAGANVLGVVLNRVPDVARGLYAQYYDGPWSGSTGAGAMAQAAPASGRDEVP